MILSIGMMVKNEEKYLDRCLKSLMPILEELEAELVIVDTGSTDSTVTIAKRYTDKIYYYEWNNDFSEMRNITISNCIGKWFLCIDGDEILQETDEIIEFFKSNESEVYNSCTLKVKNYINSTNKNLYSTVNSLRLFKKDEEFRYEGSVHNQPVYKGPVKILNTIIEHYGYISDDKKLMERKFIRTSNLLLNELEKNPTDIYYRYQLMTTYILHGDKEKAFEEAIILINSMNDFEKKINKYVFSRCISCYLECNKLIEVENLCEYILNLEEGDFTYKIDIYYYLAECLRLMGDGINAIKNYKSYIDILNKYLDGSLKLDTSIIVDTETYDKIAQANIINQYYKEKKYKEVIKEGFECKDDEVINLILSALVNSLIKEKQYLKLNEYYRLCINNLEKKYKYKFIDILENIIRKSNSEIKAEIYKTFRNQNDTYGILNSIRLGENKNEIIKLIDYAIDIIDFNMEPDCYGELLYYMLKFNHKVIIFASKLEYKNLIRYIEYCEKNSISITKCMLKYVEDYKIDSNDFRELRLMIIFSRVLILLNKVDDEKSEEVFYKYVKCGVNFIKYIYSEFIIENELIYEVKNDEDRFFIYMKRAYEEKNNNEKLFFKYLKSALKVYPDMKNGIERILNEIKTINNKRNDEIDKLKSKLLSHIDILIKEEKIDEAQLLINECKRTIPNDEDIYSYQAIIYILKERLEKAHEILEQAIKIYPNSRDLLYNFAYVYDKKNDWNNALKYYNYAYRVSEKQFKSIIKENIQYLIDENNLNYDINKLRTYDSEPRKILIICDFYSPYIKAYVESMKEEFNILFDVCTLKTAKVDYINYIEVGNINKFLLYSNIEELNSELDSATVYNAIHIHYLSPYYSYAYKQIRTRCEKLIITIWGSDYYRTSLAEKNIQKTILENSDIITFDNQIVMKEFSDDFGKEMENKSRIVRFGLSALKEIDKLDHIKIDDIKKDINIPVDSIVVQCGYNAKSVHNHLRIIDAIIAIKEKLPSNIIFIFPMTYGIVESYCIEVKEKLNKSGLKYIILEEFLQFNDMAKITKVTDIMIHLQTTDTLSATMQEHMYNGNIVITGEWLPYKPLEDLGIVFWKISEIHTLGNLLIKIIKNIEKYKKMCQGNKQSIWNFSSWESVYNDWSELYTNEKQKVIFNHEEYWNTRYSYKYNLEASGTMGLGVIYNKYLYESRLDILKCVINKIYSDNINKKSILEIGPGTGFFTNYFKNIGVKKYEGIDISTVATKKLKYKYKEFEFMSGDISNEAYFHNKNYNLIFGSDVLLHLTEDCKFKKAIANISNSLSEDGIYLAIEPVRFGDVCEEESDHNRFIDIDFLDKILKENGLEITECIPVTFFMDYPFDVKKNNELGEIALRCFNKISNYYSNINITNVRKEVTKHLYYLDKSYLLKYNIGFSNSFLIIKKINSIIYPQIDIKEVWGNILLPSMDYAKDKIEKNIGLVLNKQ